MRTTPEIPERIQSFTYPGYTNVFQLLPGCPRLYCTETLLGDWNGATLLLAKDAAPTSLIRARAKREGVGAWRHSDRSRGDRGGCRTNEQVKRFASKLPDTQLYGSATANMLCDKQGMSRSLPGLRSGPLHDYLAGVLSWVFNNMPNLRAVACLGQDAWYLAMCAFDQIDAAQRGCEYRDSERLFLADHQGRNFAVSCHFHPAARVNREQAEKGWSTLVEYLRAA